MDFNLPAELRMLRDTVARFEREELIPLEPLVLERDARRGYADEPALPLEYMSRVCRVYRIVEGPSGIHRWTIARDLLKNGQPAAW